MVLNPPDLVAFVLVADGQKVQQHFIEVTKGKVNTHHCNCITWGHLITEEQGHTNINEKAEQALVKYSNSYAVSNNAQVIILCFVVFNAIYISVLCLN